MTATPEPGNRDERCRCGHGRHSHRDGYCTAAVELPGARIQACGCLWFGPAAQPAGGEADGPTEDDVVGTCDWGGCNGDTVALRRDSRDGRWLSVCVRHRTKASVAVDLVMNDWPPTHRDAAGVLWVPVEHEPTPSVAPDSGPWRVGRSYGIHVYEGDRPVATFHHAEDAARAVIAVNRHTGQDTGRLRDALLVHHPIMRSETGPFSGCRCGQVQLGQDVVAHVVTELRRALDGPA